MDNVAITDFLKELKLIQLKAYYQAGNNSVHLPSYQGSTFRGVFGHVFKKIACMCPKQNKHHENCPYAYIFETSPQKDVSGVISSEDIPRPFIISSDTKQHYSPGERFAINVTLFGNAVGYIEYFIYVLFHMGNMGFGKGNQQAELRQVFLVDENGDYQNQIFQKQKITNVDFVLNGGNFLEDKKNKSNVQLYFVTPARIKYQGHYIDTPDFHKIFRSAVRRITSLLYYHHKQQQLDIDFKELFKKAEKVKLVHSDVSWYDWERYSNRQKERMKLGGIVGKATYEGDLEPFIPWLQLAEWTHIGKNTTFGLGKIRVVFD
ncbi:CRISPR system precrRNA processing endoribonuclease RAMP protein Cas6 [Robertmurraya andreesenii]|uniref:CRISPR-associated endoribonuclease Cas6 n=1 Tax=Anoxybacillus andreesenii TaxID=1325932 RepID=A0ABT9V8U6_9BACL|nr:CRISPR system precrRNA processing endoribonuclease RAMP protein Cas6 [Robertmurraya andreesenii]MDQ0157387.1 CRISPR-associated endoribonuclease Cas6 [Robertmurraya andreesenii]